MFEDVCLQCGKHLHDDGRAYCSDECQSLDSVSPSISSASSAVSSPCLSGYPLTGDVPPLVPSAMGSAFRDYPNHYSLSSSASSTAWSVVSDEDPFDHAAIKFDSEFIALDPDSTDIHTKPSFIPPTIHSSALSYARRPSATDNRSTVPVLHQRTSSVSASDYSQGIPSSAPLYSPTKGASSDEEDAADQHPRTKILDHDKSTLTGVKTKRFRNRASLPAYFSLLQINGDTRSSPAPVQVARPSPPTPKVPMASLTNATAGPHHSPQILAPTLSQSTPRGRRREPGTSRCSRRSEVSSSRSRSRSRTQFGSHSGEDSAAQDWSNVQPDAHAPRGRATIRRNSSPSKLVLSGYVPGQSRSSEPLGRARSGRSDSRKSRGRACVSELDGIGGGEFAPGYGHGRSGLIDRERLPAHHVVGAFR